MADDELTKEQLLQRLDAARRELAEAYATAENASDPILRFERGGRHTYVNRATQEVAGMSADQFIGRTHREMGFPEELCELWENAIEKVFATKQESSLDFEIDLAGRHIVFELKLHPEMGADGEVSSVLGVSREITDRKRSEQALREKNAEMQALFQAYPDLSFRLSTDGVILDFIAGRTSDLFTTPENFLGKRMQEVLPLEVAQQFEAGASQGPERKMFSMEYSLPLPQGERFFEARVIPILDDQFFAIVRDITDRKLAEEERRKLEGHIQQAQKLESLGILAGGVAHDFNNILTGLLGNADLALMELPAHSPVRQYILDIQEASRRAADLTNQMLAYSGKGRFVVEEIDVNALMRDMSGLFSSAISRKANLKYELRARLPGVRADATQLRQIALNLVTNAADAIDGGAGEIRLSTDVVDWTAESTDSGQLVESLPDGRYVVLEVNDNGVGMNAETQARVFEPFFTTKFTGRGLGLAAVQGIVRGHGGAIFVDSEEGRGTTFRVLLPALSRAAAEAHGSGNSVEAWRGRGTILLVDDEEAVRKVATRMLERLGFSVLAAPGGQEAIDLFQEQHAEIACVILDLKMPQVGGEEVYAEIRKLSDVPVILSSGFGESESTKQFKHLGLAAFLQKPYELAALSRTLRATLGKSP